MAERKDYQKKHSEVDSNFYRNLLLKKIENGTATESEIAWVEQNFQPPKAVYKAPRINKILDKSFFRKTIRHIKDAIDK